MLATLAASSSALLPSPAHLTSRSSLRARPLRACSDSSNFDAPGRNFDAPVDEAFSAELYAALRTKSEPVDEPDNRVDDETPVDLQSIIEHVRAAGGSAPKIALQLFDGQRGVVATEDVASGELLCEVPYELVFADDELGMPLKFDPSVRLAAALLRERLSPSAERAAHLDAVEGAVPVLLHRLAADSIVRKRMPPSLRALVVGLEERDRGLATALASTIAQTITGFVPGVTSDAELAWCMDVATTRAYTLALAVEPGADVSVSVDFGAGESLSELVARGDAKLTQVVAPLLDMFNHRHGASTRVELRCDPADGRPLALRVLAGAAHAAGEQVCLSYGPKSSEALLASYGFVPEGRNPHNRISSEAPSWQGHVHVWWRPSAGQAASVGWRLLYALGRMTGPPSSQLPLQSSRASDAKATPILHSRRACI